MIEASRSYEARSYATRRSHLADVLPSDAHKAWSAPTIFGWREPVKVAAVTVASVAAFYIPWSIFA